MAPAPLRFFLAEQAEQGYACRGGLDRGDGGPRLLDGGRGGGANASPSPER